MVLVGFCFMSFTGHVQHSYPRRLHLSPFSMHHVRAWIPTLRRYFSRHSELDTLETNSRPIETLPGALATTVADFDFSELRIHPTLHSDCRIKSLHAKSQSRFASSFSLSTAALKSPQHCKSLEKLRSWS